LTLQEQNRFTRGLISWLGFESIGVPFPRRSRKKGTSKATSFEVIALAVRGILSHSYMLLDLISILGIIASFLSLVLFSVFIVIWILNGGVLYSLGFFSTLALFGFGIILTALGLISKYISLIYEEVKARPHYIIKDRI
jgi:dolichol-phosphate mannosyltransferase